MNSFDVIDVVFRMFRKGALTKCLQSDPRIAYRFFFFLKLPELLPDFKNIIHILDSTRKTIDV